MSTVLALVEQIKDNRINSATGGRAPQTASSSKDEIAVMTAMLNDRTYSVDVYDKNGIESKFCPADVARNLAANIISKSAKVTKEEAAKLADGYEFQKSDAVSVLTISKEFVNTFIQTGRKLPLGGREKSNVAISIKEVEATTRTFPKKIGIENDGTAKYGSGEAKVPAHESLRVYAGCPTWVQ